MSMFDVRGKEYVKGRCVSNQRGINSASVEMLNLNRLTSRPIPRSILFERRKFWVRHIARPSREAVRWVEPKISFSQNFLPAPPGTPKPEPRPNRGSVCIPSETSLKKTPSFDLVLILAWESRAGAETDGRLTGLSPSMGSGHCQVGL